MASAIGSATEAILSLKFQDFRGQTLTRRYAILGTLSDASVTALVDAVDAVTNAKLIAVSLESIRPITGMKGAAVNALERNISEVMELAFLANDPTVTPNKTVTKTFLIPSMVGAIELIDGSPDPANSALDTLTGLLETALVFREATGAISGPVTTYSPAESHHITAADIVDTH